MNSLEVNAMKRYDLGVKEVISEVMDKQSPTCSFNEIWIKSNIRKTKNYCVKKVYAIPLIVVITCIMMFTVGFASYQYARNIDKIDYPFVNDSEVIGKWKAVDFVQSINDFSEEKKGSTDRLYLKELVFIKEGRMLSAIEDGNGKLAESVTTWTKGKVLNKQEKTDSSYIIKNINGKQYMFFQWKSGDYVFRNALPNYYVLEKIDSLDYSGYKTEAIEDSIDYAFENDPDMLGRWESVDFVKEIKDFDPTSKNWIDDLYLKEIEIKSGGEANIECPEDYLKSGNYWTKGLLISKVNKTASKVVIQEINNSTYMFYEWKSGDYIFRGMKPFYYVLKKVD